MKCFTHQKKYQQKSNSQTCFTPEFSTHISHLKHYDNIYLRERGSKIVDTSKTTRNLCNRCLDNAMYSYGQDKAMLFARNFSPSSTFDDDGHRLPDFSTATKNRLSNIYIQFPDV